MMKLADGVVEGLLLLSGFVLEHLHVFLVARLLVAHLLLVVLHRIVVPLLRSLSFFLQPSLQSVLLYFEERLQLT